MATTQLNGNAANATLSSSTGSGPVNQFSPGADDFSRRAFGCHRRVAPLKGIPIQKDRKT